MRFNSHTANSFEAEYLFEHLNHQFEFPDLEFRHLYLPKLTQFLVTMTKGLRGSNFSSQIVNLVLNFILLSFIFVLEATVLTLSSKQSNFEIRLQFPTLSIFEVI